MSGAGGARAIVRMKRRPEVAVRLAGSGHRVRSAHSSRLASAWLVMVAALLVHTSITTPAHAAESGDAVQLVALLKSIQSAAQRENYTGTFIHQQANQVQSSRIAHIADKAGEHEKLEILDGQAREFIRHNEDVRCYVPDSKVVLVEKRVKYDSFPALLTSAPIDLEQHYRLSLEGNDRVAGRAAQILRLEAADQMRYGYRLWFDRDTHLLLKAQTLGAKGSLVEQVAFSDISIGGSIAPDRVKPSVANTDGWRIETSQMLPADLARAGWSVANPVPGFHKVMEVRRAFGSRDDVGQMVFSDGLAAISIFIEPGPPPGVSEGSANRGPINVVTRRHGSHWLTIVGDVPGDAVKQMADAIAFKPPT